MEQKIETESSNIKAEDIINEIKDLSLLISKEEIEPNSNPFPIEVFPAEIQRLILETNECLNYPIDFIAASILYALSVSNGNTHRVEVKAEWTESAVIYIAIVGPPGTNKSHPLSFALKPIEDRDRQNYLKYKQQFEQYNLEVKAKKKNDTKGDNSKKPIWSKNILSDYTLEALAERLKENKRGIGIYVDELAGWVKNFNRYNKGSEMEFWLSAWSCRPVNIDRKTTGPVYIALPFVSVIGTIQNSILFELTRNNGFENGFMDRILFVIPDNIQKSYWNERELNIEVTNTWRKIVYKLLDLTNPEVLKFSPASKKILFEWQKKITDYCNEAKDEKMGAMYSKIEIYVIRMALILQMAMFSTGEDGKEFISCKAIEGAIRLMEYFKNSAIKVGSLISNVDPLLKYPLIKQSLYKALPDEFTTEEGVSIAEGLQISERTYKRFINEKELFRRISHGHNKKLI